MTPAGKAYKSKPRRKALKCTVELTLHAITCPGVLLPSHTDVYVSVRMMGQYNKTKCVSPTFPLLLHESMVFTKIFSEAFDPGDVADHLENDATCLELIQLVPPEGEILATFKENTRDFLYPGLRLIPQPRGSDREVLMRKSAFFPGTSPKVEFSTMSVIEECDISQPAVILHRTATKTSKTCPVGPRKSNLSAAETCGYQRPTVASQSRCSSPYTHRKMCQLTDDAKQRLRHLQLGPYTFKKDTVPQLPFVVPCSPNSSLIEFSTTSSAVQPSPKRKSHHQTSSGHSQSVCPVSPGEKSTSFLSSPFPRRNHAYQSTPVFRSLRDQSPLLSHSTLRERFQSPNSPSEEIHRRVQKLLVTLATPRRLAFEEESEDGDPGPNAPGPSVHHSQLHEDRVIPGAPSVHLDNGTFWTNRAAKYTRKSHRAVFEDSLGKIYKNLYRKASSPTHSDSQSNWT